MDEERYKFFFVCGHGRSGTTWTEKVLDLHPRINCKGEFHLEVVRHGFDTFTNRPWHLAHTEPMRSLAEECFRDTVRRCMLSVAEQKPDAEWIGDRTPRPLRPLLPGCPHVLVVRDGRDVAVSYTIHQLKTNGLDLRTEPFKGIMAPLQEALNDDPNYFRNNPGQLFADESWTRHVARKWARRCRNDLEALGKFESGALDGRAMLLKYEALRLETEHERARLYRFLNLDPEEAAPLSAENETAPGFEKENPAGKSRKGIVGDWKNYASNRFSRIFKEEAGEMLITLGYEEGTGW